MNNVEKLEQLEKALLDPNKNDIRDTYRKLGHLKSEHGLAEPGLEDLLRAYAAYKDPKQTSELASRGLSELRKPCADAEFPVATTPFALLAQLGEAFRIVARDHDFSAGSGGLEQTKKTMAASLKCFDRAVELMAGQPVAQQAWVLAHRGAARTMGYWLMEALGAEAAGNVFGADSLDGLFKLAKKDFNHALALKSKYAWCRQFKAFLRTIRGTPSDFSKASVLLEQARSQGATNDPALERSQAILFFNLAEQSDDARRQAKISLDHGLVAMKSDPEQFPAAFYAAASMSLLAKGDDATSAIYKKSLRPAIESARLRARNAISQASAALIGLRALESELGVSDPAEASRCKRYLDLAMETPPDLETRVVFDRAIEQLLKLKKLDSGVRAQLEQFLSAFRPETSEKNKTSRQKG